MSIREEFEGRDYEFDYLDIEYIKRRILKCLEKDEAIAVESDEELGLYRAVFEELVPKILDLYPSQRDRDRVQLYAINNSLVEII